MKYLSEYRDKDTVERLLREIKKTVTKPWTLMEICGGQTHSLVKNGILDMIFPEITMVHGPGCPVCVTPVEMIDKAVSLAEQGYTICSFGDMLRVPDPRKVSSGPKQVALVFKLFTHHWKLYNMPESIRKSR